ncbi:MAG: hypothetical protein ABIQ38_08860 [Ilumatobacteraceae bacterium]
MKRIIFCQIVAATFLAGIVASCGGSSDSASTTAVVADVVVIAESGIRLDQSSYAASSGSISIAYVNHDTIRHTLIVEKDGTKVSGFELNVSKKGDTDKGTVTLAAGSYQLMCTVPGHQNMKASFTIG